MGSAISIAVDFVRHVLREYSDVVDAVATRATEQKLRTSEGWPSWCAFPQEFVLRVLDELRPYLSDDDRSETSILIATALAWSAQCILLDFSEAALRRIEDSPADVVTPTPGCPTKIAKWLCVFIDGKNILTLQQVRCVGHFVSFDFQRGRSPSLVVVTLTANEEITGVIAVPTILPLDGQSVRAASEDFLRAHEFDVLDDGMSAFAITVAEFSSKLLGLLHLADGMPRIDRPAPLEQLGTLHLPTGALCVSVSESSRHLH